MHKLAFVVLALAACGVDGDEGRPDDSQTDWHSGGKADGQSCDFASMSARTYYNQFAYAKTETAGTSWYRVGSTWDLAAKLDNGDKASLRAYFLANDRVIVEYHEEHYVGGGQSDVLNETVIVTHATIDEATRAITIAGVAKGTPLTVNNNGQCAPAIALEHLGDLRSPGLAGDHSGITSSNTTAFVIDPDHLDEVPSATARQWFEEDVASGKIKILRF